VDYGSGWDDPAELRIWLDVALQQIAELTEENSRLAAQLSRSALPPAPPGPAAEELSPRLAGHGLPYADQSSSLEAKVALFRALFAGREDVYATRWVRARDGRAGWSPAEKDPWNRKKRETEREFFPLTEDVIYQHLRRPAGDGRGLHAGLYPMFTDDTTRLLACDFDDHQWRADAAAYAEACRQAGVPVLTEISRSGAGAHAWTFFTDPVPAGKARELGMAMLRRAIDARNGMTLASYDRLFPSQDFLPVHARGGARFGNLIALPLCGEVRAQDLTVFCDPGTWTPYPDQFAFLSAAGRLSSARVRELLEELEPLRAGPSPAGPPPRPRRGALGVAPRTVRARAGAMLAIATAGLPSALTAELKHRAAIHNPEFYRRQNQRYSTFGTPRLVTCYDDTDPDWLALPRGLRDEAAAVIASAGGTLKVTGEFPETGRIDARFTGELTAVQAEAVEVMSGHSTGVLVAATGTGKTVMACALIARHRVPTAIIVNRADLLAQWRDRLNTFLALTNGTVGSLGSGRDRRGGQVDLLMLQSVTRRDARDGLLEGYGLVIVDECHMIGAPAAEAAIRQVNVQRWIGLSATPYRADQMDALITMQCGPIRHEIEDQTTFAKHLIIHPTGFTTMESGSHGASIQAIYGELAADQARSQLIADQIADAHQRERASLVLTSRIEHITRLTALLGSCGIPTHALHGGLPAVDRDKVRALLSTSASGPLTVIAIDKVAGEGLDAPILNTLFLASPIAFKGRVIQQVGRIMRDTETRKLDVEVHDFLDLDVPLLERMHHKRRRTLIQRGFTVQAADTRETTTTSSAPPTASTPEPAPAMVRSWAQQQGIQVSTRGKLRDETWNAYRDAHS